MLSVCVVVLVIVLFAVGCAVWRPAVLSGLLTALSFGSMNIGKLLAAANKGALVREHVTPGVYSLSFCAVLGLQVDITCCSAAWQER